MWPSLSITGPSVSPQISADRLVFEQASRVITRLRWYGRGPYTPPIPESAWESLNKWLRLGKKCSQALLPSSFQATLPSAPALPPQPHPQRHAGCREVLWVEQGPACTAGTRLSSGLSSAAEVAAAAKPPSPQSCLSEASLRAPHGPVKNGSETKRHPSAGQTQGLLINGRTHCL